MISPDNHIKHQPLPSRVHFIRPNEVEKRGVYFYTDTQIAMALQLVDSEDGLKPFNQIKELKKGTVVRIERVDYVIKEVVVKYYNHDITSNHDSYPLEFDTSMSNSGFVLSIEVILSEK